MPNLMLGPGLVTDVMLGVLALEVLLIGGLSARAARYRGLLKLLPTIAAGGFLLLAFRSFNHGADWRISALLLSAAGLSHGLDLALRWQRQIHTSG